MAHRRAVHENSDDQAGEEPAEVPTEADAASKAEQHIDDDEKAKARIEQSNVAAAIQKDREPNEPENGARSADYGDVWVEQDCSKRPSHERRNVDGNEGGRSDHPLDLLAELPEQVPEPEPRWRWPDKAKITFLQEWDDDQLLLGTYDDGLYLLGTNQPVRFADQPALLAAWPYDALRLDDGGVIVMTIHAGIFPGDSLDATFNPYRLFVHAPRSADAVRDYEDALGWFNFGLTEIDPNGRFRLSVLDARGEEVARQILVPHR